MGLRSSTCRRDAPRQAAAGAVGLDLQHRRGRFGVSTAGLRGYCTRGEAERSKRLEGGWGGRAGWACVQEAVPLVGDSELVAVVPDALRK